MIRVCRQNGAERREEFALNIDIAPTVISAAGARVPDVIQGLDLSPLYVGDRAAAWRDEFFYEHPTITSRDRIPSSRAVVRRDCHVHWPEFGYEQLSICKSTRKKSGISSTIRDPQHNSQRCENAWKIGVRGCVEAAGAFGRRAMSSYLATCESTTGTPDRSVGTSVGNGSPVRRIHASNSPERRFSSGCAAGSPARLRKLTRIG